MERKTLASYALLRSCGCLLAATAMLTAALQHILVVLDAAGMESAALEGKLASHSHGQLAIATAEHTPRQAPGHTAVEQGKKTVETEASELRSEPSDHKKVASL
uniref:Uncharacterized protein n=1 Tax=Oryza meridionalis TaxID=40149 RepID=A0A0E0CZF6_9ORYZ